VNDLVPLFCLFFKFCSLDVSSPPPRIRFTRFPFTFLRLRVALPRLCLILPAFFPNPSNTPQILPQVDPSGVPRTPLALGQIAS